MNDVSVIRVSRCGITRGTLYGKHVLTLIWVIMTGGSFKIVSNWAVLTVSSMSSCREKSAVAGKWEEVTGCGRGGSRRSNHHLKRCVTAPFPTCRRLLLPVAWFLESASLSSTANNPTQVVAWRKLQHGESKDNKNAGSISA